jgi:hypothetical protein
MTKQRAHGMPQGETELKDIKMGIGSMGKSIKRQRKSK